MKIEAVPLFPPLRMALSLAIGGVLSWRLRESIASKWSAAVDASGADNVEAPANWLWSSEVTQLVHWLVAAFSMIMTVSAAWLFFVLLQVLITNMRWKKNRLPKTAQS